MDGWIREQIKWTMTSRWISRKAALFVQMLLFGIGSTRVDLNGVCKELPIQSFLCDHPFASASISSTQSYSPTSDFAVRPKKALEVGVLESWNLRGGEWEKVGGRRQK